MGNSCSYPRLRVGLLPVLAAALFGLAATPASATAAVAIITNRTPASVPFTVEVAETANQAAKPTTYKLAAGDQTILTLRRGAVARLKTAAGNFEIEADAIYYFGKLASGKIELGRVGLGEMPAPQKEFDLPPAAAPKKAADDEAARTIPVKLFVDEEEATRPVIWQRRLRDRVNAASEILERHCGMKLKVVGYGTWKSDNQITEFTRAVTEFSVKADPGEARIAIGFTSQYQITKGRTHLGGTRGPLARHILMREWSQHVSEDDRLELLVHELGHFLGAVHSPEPESVMRVILGDHQANARRFQIRFDPLNALAINLVAEDWHRRPLGSFAELAPLTQTRLRAVYEAINQALPDDLAAAQFLYYLNRMRPTAGPVPQPGGR